MFLERTQRCLRTAALGDLGLGIAPPCPETAPSWLLVSHHSPWKPQEVVVTPTLTSEGNI